MKCLGCGYLCVVLSQTQAAEALIRNALITGIVHVITQGKCLFYGEGKSEVCLVVSSVLSGGMCSTFSLAEFHMSILSGG